MKSCCNQNRPNYFTILVWFIITTIGNPSMFLWILPFPKQMFLYSVPQRNVLMLHIFPYISFEFCVRIAYLAILALLAYLFKNNVHKFLLQKVMPTSISSLLWQLVRLAIGFTNLYWYTFYGMDATIIALAYLLVIAAITVISVIGECVTIYKIVKQRYV